MIALSQPHFPLQFTFQLPASLRHRVGGFSYDQGRYYAYAHETGHGEICVLPGLGRGNVECAGAGNEQGHPVAEHIAGRHGPL